MNGRTSETIGDGSIEVITGCMFSGKTSELINRVQRARIAGYEVTVFSPDIDDRYDETAVCSHDEKQVKAQILPTNQDGARQLLERAESDVIAIDEANFFPNNIIPAIEELASRGKAVIVSGLDQTFLGEPFEPMPQLAALADTVEKRQAICKQCGNVASKNQLLEDGEPVTESDKTVVVGGNSMYEPRCRECFVASEDTDTTGLNNKQ